MTKVSDKEARLVKRLLTFRNFILPVGLGVFVFAASPRYSTELWYGSTRSRGWQVFSPLIELQRWINQIFASHERHTVLHGRTRTPGDSQRARRGLVVEFEMQHIARHPNSDQMPHSGDLLPGSNGVSSSYICLALDLSVTGEDRSMINLQGKSFTVKWIWSSSNNTVSDGVDRSASGKVKITAGV